MHDTLIGGIHSLGARASKNLATHPPRQKMVDIYGAYERPQAGSVARKGLDA